MLKNVVDESETEGLSTERQEYLDALYLDITNKIAVTEHWLKEKEGA